MSPDPLHVVVVGGGFAGLGCVKRLAREDGVRVTLVDRHNYHQFQPLLYQVATSQLASDRHRVLAAQAVPRRRRRRRQARRGDGAVDPATHTRRRSPTASASRRRARAGGRLAAELLQHARAPRSTRSRSTRSTTPTRLRSRVLEVFEAADRDPSLIDQGALTFVVVGGGADRRRARRRARRPDRRDDDAWSTTTSRSARRRSTSSTSATRCSAGSPTARTTTPPRCSARKGVQLHLGVAVTEIGAGHVALGDGSVLRTRCVVWGGGLKAAPVAAAGRAAAGPRRADRRAARPVRRGFPGVYVAGDVANIPRPTATRMPQLGSVALQSGSWAAENVLADVAGQAAPRLPLPRQGDHGDDRPRRRDRRGRRRTATSCTARSPSPPGSASTRR